MGSRSRLFRRAVLLRSILAQQLRFSTSCTAVPASATSATRIRDEVNFVEPGCAGILHSSVDQHAARKAQLGSSWFFAAAGLMAFSTTSLTNALPVTEDEEKKKTVDGVETPKKQRVIFVLGGPGSGKGTQCAKIVDNYGFVHLSAGDLLRAEIKSGSSNGNMIQNMIKDGKIVPSEVTVKLLEKAMNESKNDKFLIDGFPRNEENRAAFENVTSELMAASATSFTDDQALLHLYSTASVGYRCCFSYVIQVCFVVPVYILILTVFVQTGIMPEFILFFDCPEEELEKRLLGRNEGRVDDNIETIRKRFKVFIESSLPVIEHYETIGKCRKINATRSKDEVFNMVEPLFKPFLSNSSCEGLTQTIMNYTKPSVIQD